jgi:6-phosphofructokinase 1
MDPLSGRMRVRMVDIESDRYKIARGYMLRLKREDLADPVELQKLASAAKLSKEAFVARFGSLVDAEPQPMSLHL